MNVYFPPDFHFEQPYFGLMIFFLIPAAYYFYRTQQLKKEADRILRQSFYQGKKEIINFIFLVGAFLSFVICLMEPVGFMKKEEDPILSMANLNQPLPILFLLDNSLSMSTPDASFGKTRFEEASEIILSFLPQIPSIPKALYTFNDHLQKIIPVTLDSTFMNLTVEALTPVISHEGTDFLETFSELQKALEVKGAVKPRQIILITDGEDTNPHPDVKAIEEIVSSLAIQGITVNVIGVGSSAGGDIPSLIFHKKPVHSSLDEPFLTSLSEHGHGKYINAKGISTLGLNRELLNNIQGETYQSLYTAEPVVSYTPLYPFFLLITILCLLRGFT